MAKMFADGWSELRSRCLKCVICVILPYLPSPAGVLLKTDTPGEGSENVSSDLKVRAVSFNLSVLDTMEPIARSSHEFLFPHNSLADEQQPVENQYEVVAFYVYYYFLEH